MEQYPKILVGTLTGEGKDYCFPQWQYQNHNIWYPQDRIERLIVDNSPTDDYSKYVAKFGFTVRHVELIQHDIQKTLANSHNAIRDYFLSTDATHLLHLESDIMIQRTTLQRLLMEDKDVIGANYFINHGDQSSPIPIIEGIHVIDGGICRMTDNMPTRYGYNFFDGKVKKVHSIGLGCVLIKRHVLEKIPFKSKGWQKDFIAPDSHFAEDCAGHQIDIYSHTGIFLDHKNQDWGKNIDWLTYQQKQVA